MVLPVMVVRATALAISTASSNSSRSLSCCRNCPADCLLKIRLRGLNCAQRDYIVSQPGTPLHSPSVWTYSLSRDQLKARHMDKLQRAGRNFLMRWDPATEPITIAISRPCLRRTNSRPKMQSLVRDAHAESKARRNGAVLEIGAG